MKVNIKGLVFTGFAAAILSANAMAASPASDINSVTSKSYVDTKFQVKSNQASIGSTDGSWVALDTEIGERSNNTTAPTALAVKTYVDNAAAGSNFVEDAINSGTTDKAPSEDAVYNALALKQNASTAVTHTQDSAVGSVTVPVYIDSTGAAQPTTLGTAATADVSNGIADDDAGLTTGDQVHDYVDSVASGINSTMAGKQLKSNANAGTYNVGHTGDTWATLGTAGYVQIDTTNTSAPKIQLDAAQITSSSALQSNSTKLTREQDVKAYVDSVASSVVQSQTYTADEETVHLDTSNGANEFSALTSAVASDAQTLVTGGQVYDYVQGITHGNNIPAQDSSICTASTPCALVAELDTSTGKMEQHWRVMAVSATNQSPAAGTLGDLTSGS